MQTMYYIGSSQELPLSAKADLKLETIPGQANSEAVVCTDMSGLTKN